MASKCCTTIPIIPDHCPQELESNNVWRATDPPPLPKIQFSVAHFISGRCWFETLESCPESIYLWILTPASPLNENTSLVVFLGPCCSLTYLQANVQKSRQTYTGWQRWANEWKRRRKQKQSQKKHISAERFGVGHIAQRANLATGKASC